jgi:ribosomal protein S18 acetylase RimI-like enzyme
MTVFESPELVLVDSGLASDTFNLVCRARMERERALEEARKVIAYFREVGRPFTWWIGPGDKPANLGEILSAAGLERVESELAMAADLSRLSASGKLPGLRIERVRTADQLADFARVIGGTQDTPDLDVARFYELAAPVLLTGESPVWLYVGYLDEVPVATAEVTVAGGVAGLYNISTLPSYRRRGFGTAMTLRPLLDARAVGVGTAVLQASSEGARIYARVGFEIFGQITEYKPAGSPG